MAIASRRKAQRARIVHIDVKRAHLNAPVAREVFVTIPAEDHQPGDEWRCARLVKSLYGTRDAASNWERLYTQVLEAVGFERGVASTCAFYHKDRRVHLTVHGDDFTAVMDDDQVEWFVGRMATEAFLKMGWAH